MRRFKYGERGGHRLYYVSFFRWWFLMVRFRPRVIGCENCKETWDWTADVTSTCSKEKTE